MIIEHSFITTLEGPDAMRRASEYLTCRGFEVLPQGAFTMESQLHTLSFRRGLLKAWRARSIAELPQQVRLEWDRGKVSLAASIEPHERSFWMDSGGIKPDAPKLRIHRELLMGIATTIEALLGNTPVNGDVDEVWRRVDGLIEQDRLKRRRRRRIKWSILILVLLTPVVLGILAAIYDW